ncbi:hypothetical protein GCM10027168_44480 [Streptomyces capparidis]
MDVNHVIDPVVGWAADDPYLTAAIAVSVLMTLTAVVAARRKHGPPGDGGRGRRWPLEGIGAQAVVALGGVAVSVHGLWSFAVDFAGLDRWFAVGFIGVFDAAEMCLLIMMYRAADPEDGWTAELRLMHRTAWTLVAFSAAMNAIHAPTWWARPVLGSIPALAAWLIELKLRAKLHRPGADDEDAKPGPIRLVVLGWQHAWSALFAVLGLDAAGSGSEIARAALAQRAAARVYRLNLALETLAELQGSGAAQWRRERAKRRVVRRRKQAQKAIDRAAIATDAAQSLAMARRMAGLTGVDDLAQLDYSDAPQVMSMLERLAVVPAAQRITSSTRAMEAEAARERAEAARLRAEEARQRAEEEEEAARQRAAALTEAAQQELEVARAAREEAETAATKAAEDLATARQEAQRAEDARKEAEAARLRAETTAAVAERRAQELATEAELARERLERAENDRARLEEQTANARNQQHGTEDQLAALRRELEDYKARQERARGEYEQVAEQARKAREQAGREREELERLADELAEQQRAVEDAAERRRAAEEAARRAAEQTAARKAEAEEIGMLLERLRGELAEHTTDGPVPPEGARVFESDAKQQGWEYYVRQTRAAEREPRATELAERFGVSDGNARNWIRDFRALRARQLAAGAARTEPVNGTPIPA